MKLRSVEDHANQEGLASNVLIMCEIHHMDNVVRDAASQHLIKIIGMDL